MARQPKPETPATRAPTTTTAGPPAEEAGGILTVDRAAMFANWRALAQVTRFDDLGRDGQLPDRIDR